MTKPRDHLASPGPRRPPAAPSQWATVTELGSRRPEVVATPSVLVPEVDGSLALDAALPAQPPGGLPETPELRLVTNPKGTRTAQDEVRVWAGRFAQAVVEVLGGDRPLAQLLRWTSEGVYAELDRRLSILARTSDAGRRMRTVRPQVRSVHVCHPTPDAAEVAVHVRHGTRSRAIAARLELTGGRWQCTALQFG